MYSHTLLYFDDENIFQENEDDLQRPAYSLLKLAREYSIELPAIKSMPWFCREPCHVENNNKWDN